MKEKTNITTEEFIKSQGLGFHLRLLQYLDMYSSKDEIKEIQETNSVLFFNFPEGKFSIKWGDLSLEALREFKEIGKKLDIDIPESFKELLNQ